LAPRASRGTLGRVNAGASKANWGYSLLIWLVMVLYVAPLLVAWNLWDTLDALPYLLCLVVGAGCSWVAWRLRRRRASTAPLGVLGFALIAWAPCLGVAVGLGANQMLDHSPAIAHDASFLGYRRAHKGPDHARFSSWREPGGEERLTCSSWRQAELCGPLKVGAQVVVTTHGGALGWEWVERIAPR
jgi:hypothetical protein